MPGGILLQHHVPKICVEEPPPGVCAEGRSRSTVEEGAFLAVWLFSFYRGEGVRVPLSCGCVLVAYILGAWQAYMIGDISLDVSLLRAATRLGLW